mgnify:CR=1 FL=1
MARNEKYATNVPCTWCPGCGNFSIIEALEAALTEMRLEPNQVLISSGIGQAAKVPHFIKCNGFNGLHGRAVPVAIAAKLAADDLKVIVHSGDGCSYGEGCNHLIHGIRRNIDVTVIVHDNRIYGLTKGQSSPTTPFGQATSTERCGVRAEPLNPIALALSQRCSFVAQAFSGAKKQLTGLIQEAVEHKGFSLINVLQPCVSFNKVHTFKWFKENTYELDESFDETDIASAFSLVMRDSDKLPLGVLHRNNRPTYSDLILEGIEHPLRDRKVDPERARRLFDRFR